MADLMWIRLNLLICDSLLRINGSFYIVIGEWTRDDDGKYRRTFEERKKLTRIYTPVGGIFIVGA